VGRPSPLTVPVAARETLFQMMNSNAVPNEGAGGARAVLGAVTDIGRCVPCLAVLAGLPELSVRAVLVALTGVVDTVAPCGACGARRLVYRLGTEARGGRQTGARNWP
jgi:hypothetical protein